MGLSEFVEQREWKGWVAQTGWMGPQDPQDLPESALDDAP